MNVTQLENKFTRKFLEKEEILFAEGDKTGEGYIIEVGEINLYKKNKKVTSLGAGEVLGVWKILLNQNERYFTAKTNIKTILFVIPAGYLENIINEADPFLKHCFKQWLRITGS